MFINEHSCLQCGLQIIPRAPYLLVWGCFVASTVSEFDTCRRFLWGYLKQKLLAHRVQDIEDLKAEIRHVCSFTKDVPRAVMDGFRDELQQRTANRLSHLRHKNFKN
jgi:hypothetical protein